MSHQILLNGGMGVRVKNFDLVFLPLTYIGKDSHKLDLDL